MLSTSFGLEPCNPYEDKGLRTDCFDTVVLAEREGVRKPAPEIYRRTLDALRLTCPQRVFLDDRAVDLPPAEALGIRTVHHTTDPAPA